MVKDEDVACLHWDSVPKGVRPLHGICRNICITLRKQAIIVMYERSKWFCDPVCQRQQNRFCECQFYLPKRSLEWAVPVVPKNIFPSNIQGLPTWYEVRVSEKGYLGRRDGIDFMVAVNPQSFKKDVASVKPGGYLCTTAPRFCTKSLSGPTSIICRCTDDGNLQSRVFWCQAETVV